jgi:hypothetical protein
VLVPCERVIVSEEDNTVSLIALLQSITVSVPEGTTVPEDASAPLRWYALAQWYGGAEDQGKQYEQRLRVITPSGRVAIDSVTSFAMTEPVVRNIGVVQGFPVGETGQCSLVVSLRETGQDRMWQDIDEYPLTVVYNDGSA